MAQLPIESIRGVGKKRAELFSAMGVATAEGLLSMLPRGYLDYSQPVPAAKLVHGKPCMVQAAVVSEPKIARVRGLVIVTAKAEDESGQVSLKWYNQPYRKNQIPIGKRLYICGRADLSRGRSLQNPMLSETAPGILPVYSLPAALSQRVMRDAVRGALIALDGKIEETLPESVLTQYNLMPLPDAYQNAHFPQNETLKCAARRRLAFEQALVYLLAVEQSRGDAARQNGVALDCAGLLERYNALLPFEPTGAQTRAMHEIARDLSQKRPMNRLLQGDVGSGKTAVAMFALFAAVENGMQGALMAPTEILAAQHARTLAAMFGERVCPLTGGMKKSAREDALARIADGRAAIVVGTHALFSADVEFRSLGVVVTDEQHRFGVSQRARVAEKGNAPHVLVMSATPIPRTLALMLFADLDVSVLDELPPNRPGIVTRYVPRSRRADMYRFLGELAGRGGQAYAVCPFIDESEELPGVSAAALCEELRALLPDVPVGLLHGRMREGEKARAIAKFNAGETKILVTTTVIEVGVHVPQASVMVVESADRFGLAQLHQLRGRVGRGEQKSYCFLLCEQPSEAALARVKTMIETSDGFLIAEKDFAMRGYGELLGTLQSGMGASELVFGMSDAALLQEAKSGCSAVIMQKDARSAALCMRAHQIYRAGFGQISMN